MIDAATAATLSQAARTSDIPARKLLFQKQMQCLVTDFLNNTFSNEIKNLSKSHGRTATYLTSDEVKSFLRKKGFSFYTTTSWTQGWNLAEAHRPSFGMSEGMLNIEHPVDTFFALCAESLRAAGYAVGEPPVLGVLDGYRAKEGWNNWLTVRW